MLAEFCRLEVFLLNPNLEACVKAQLNKLSYGSEKCLSVNGETGSHRIEKFRENSQTIKKAKIPLGAANPKSKSY